LLKIDAIAIAIGVVEFNLIELIEERRHDTI
jgi:hypothetical protein